MFQALRLKKADANASGVDAFLARLLAEHDEAGARAQLKTLWIGHDRHGALFQEDEEAPGQSGAGGSGRGGVRARAHTPPDSPRRPDAGDAA